MGDSNMGRIKEIQEQIEHVKWLKMQTDRSIRTSLEKTRTRQQNDVVMKMAVDSQREKSEWRVSIIRDELSKPLVINDTEMFHMGQIDDRDKLRLQKVSMYPQLWD
jgi:hypothetical protein